MAIARKYFCKDQNCEYCVCYYLVVCVVSIVSDKALLSAVYALGGEKTK